LERSLKIGEEIAKVMKKNFCLIFFFLFQVSNQALAQQTIFNVPSADVTEKNKNFLQHESQFRTKDPNYWNVTSYYARGVGDDLEIDATLFNTSIPTSQNASLGLGFKKVFSLNLESDYKPKIIFGGEVPISLQGRGVGHWIYSAASITFPQTNTRFTAGISKGSRQIFGKNATSFIGGIEQQITKKFNLIGDWYSGNNSLSILTTGFSYAFPQDFTFYGGVQIPNSKKVGRNGITIEIAKIF
jgi:hypothetical protein